MTTLILCMAITAFIMIYAVVIINILLTRYKRNDNNNAHFYITKDPEMDYYELWLGKPFLKDETWVTDSNHPCVNITELYKHINPKYKEKIRMKCGDIKEIFLDLDKKAIYLKD